MLNATYLHMESESDTYKNSYDCPRCTEKMPLEPIGEKLLDRGEYLDGLLTMSWELKENLT
ncbi:hypothetical protein YSY22_01340 [Brevibacillus formosus]